MVSQPGKKRGIPLKINLQPILHSTWIELVLRWILGVTFLYASLYKIIEPAQFAKIIYGYYLFPDISINLIAIILPFVEFFTGLFLILGINKNCWARPDPLVSGGAFFFTRSRERR